ncbi:hypothetical protein [Lentibacillus salicampi]|uniref:hypothetical protein n=1 Tax=Lentibacillus salicampi TaxID=175306 RepID=UPI001ADDC5DC|nr:hypothetical protein [Lentibacillus salicampi]
MEVREIRNTGYVLFTSGTILFGIMHLAIALFLSNSAGIAPPGLITTSLDSIAGWIPYILSIILMVIGLIFIIVKSGWWQKQKKEIKEKNQEFSDEQNKST